MKYAKHPIVDFHVGFNEEQHQYKLVGDLKRDRWEDCEPLVSVTQFVGHYKPHFDADGMAMKCALRDGNSKEQILAKWEAKKQYSCEFGTRVHENQEAMMNGENPVNMPKDEREREIMSAGWNAMQEITKLGFKPFASEKMVFSPAYHLAGTVDAIFQRGKNWVIADWKTNESINARSKYGKRMLEPIQNLDECEMVTYSLQLSLYREILQKEGYISKIAPIDLAIIHLAPEGYRIIPVEFRTEIYKLLLHFQLSRWDLPEPPF